MSHLDDASGVRRRPPPPPNTGSAKGDAPVRGAVLRDKRSGWLRRLVCRWRHGEDALRVEADLFNARQWRVVCTRCGAVHSALTEAP